MYYYFIISGFKNNKNNILNMENVLLCQYFEKKTDFSKEKNYPEDDRWLKNPIAICTLRTNLVVNELFCRICMRIDWPCPNCKSKLVIREGLYPRANCKKCNKIFNKYELKKLREQYLKENKIVY